MTPLIDMVFILLIFFIVTTHFVSETGLEVDRPVSGTADSMPAQPLRVTIDASGHLYVEGRPVSLMGLRAWLQQQHPSPIRRSLVIVADRAASAQALVQVMDEAREAGIEQVALATHTEGDAS
jgi:biopolymer transport protein ExbD